MYLSGYVAECALKAVLLDAIPKSRQHLLSEKFRGQQGHNLDFLKKEILRLHIPLPDPISQALRSLATWSTDLRYVAENRRQEDAILFLESARTILQWAERIR